MTAFASSSSIALRRSAQSFVQSVDLHRPCQHDELTTRTTTTRAVLRTRWRMTASSETATPAPSKPDASSSSNAALDLPQVSAQPELERVVCKFGGSSLADATRLREVSSLVQQQMERSKRPPIVVLSAMGPSTNELLSAGEAALRDGVVDMMAVRARAYAACKELGLDRESLCDALLLNLDQLLLGVKFLKELSPRTKDYLASFGERLSVRIFAAHLRQNCGVDAVAIDAWDIGFRSDSQFTRAELRESTYKQVRNYFDRNHPTSDNRVVVVTGFIAKDDAGNITTLGRGGSDLTAATVGAALGVTEVQVWKDVDGILSTDPRVVPEAMPVPTVSFEEAAEMAFFGAKVLHPIAMQPAMAFDVPVRVKNSYNPLHPGTVIVRSRELAAVDANPVTAISLKKNVQLVDVVSTRMLGAYGFLAEVFKAFAEQSVSVDTIATSEVSISMTLDGARRDEDYEEKQRILAERLGKIANVEFSEMDKAIVSVVTNENRGGEVVGRSVSVLNEHGINVLMISQGASKINISFVVERDVAKRAVQLIHREFFGV